MLNKCSTQRGFSAYFVIGDCDSVSRPLDRAFNNMEEEMRDGVRDQFFGRV